MCRKAHATAKPNWRWIVGQRGRWNWAFCFGSRRRTRRIKLWLNLPPIWKCRPELVAEVTNVAKRPDIETILLQGAGAGPTWGEGGKHFPQLLSWLCDSQYEDGSTKGRAQLQVERKGGQLRLTLKVADSGLCVEASHENASDAVMTLELLLGHEDCPWQLDPWPLKKPVASKKKSS